MNRAVKGELPIKRKLLSRHETAKVLGGVHIRTVDRLLKRGKLRGVKLGRRQMITVDSADEVVATAK